MIDDTLYEHMAPAIDGDLVAFVGRAESLESPSQIYVKNLRTGSLRQLTDDGLRKGSPDISGNRVVWTSVKDNVSSGSLHDLLSMETTLLPSTAPNISNIQISGGFLAWTGRYPQPLLEPKTDAIYVYNLTSGEESQITSANLPHRQSRIFDDLVVLDDSRYSISDVFVYRLDTGVESRLTFNWTAQSQADVYGDMVVWRDRGDPNLGHSEIYVHNMRTNTTRQLTHNDYSDGPPRIHGSRVAWFAKPGDVNDVFLADIELWTSVRVTYDAGAWDDIGLSDEHIVWAAVDRHYVSRMYYAEIEVSIDPWGYLLAVAVLVAGATLIILFRRRKAAHLESDGNRKVEGP